MEPGDVTAEWMSAALGGEVGSVETERIGDGLVGLNLRARLRDVADGLPSSVVLKLPSLDDTSRATGVALRIYEREVKFYTQLADSVDIRVPRCHHAEWEASTGEFVLVLEDISPAVQGDQITGCSLGEAQLAVQQLARLHGPRWDDASLDEVDWLNRWTGPSDGQNLVTLWGLFFPGFESTYAPHLSSDALELVRAFGPLLADWANNRGRPWVITHGDFRLDNMLFGAEAHGAQMTTVDWQTPAQGPPAGDLAYFCGAGLLPHERREHEQSLIDLYVAGLGAYDVQVDREWLWTQYRREAFAGVVMAVIASQIVGESDRSEAMFAAMATRHLEHALDLHSISLI